MGRERFEQGAVDLRRPRQNMTFLLVFRAAECADASTGFLDEEGTGRGIPRRESDLPEAVNTARRDISQVQRRGSRPANPRRFRQSARKAFPE